MNQSPVIEGFWKGTILVTDLLDDLRCRARRDTRRDAAVGQPGAAGVSWLYTWFFRAIPRYVLLTIMGALGILFPRAVSRRAVRLEDHPMVGVQRRLALPDLRRQPIFVGLAGGVIGLAASEAAYMAEIARAGILSVDRGQMEAAEALGMSRGKAMRRVVLPQAMRVIVPPTGNETIAMLKDTSLLIAIPVGTELFFQLQAIGARTYRRSRC